MVVAEVPLWVIHNGSSASSGDPQHMGSSAAAEANDAAQHWQQTAAQSSLALLLPGTAKSNKGSSSKCAIYSVDVHPDGTKFATAGGDGTVRIWNTGSLFVATKNSKSSGAAHFDATTGAYVSSSSSDDNASDSSSSNDHSETGQGNKEKNGSNKKNDGNESSSSSSSSLAAPQVHDLNAVVRRKKNGGVASPTKPAAAAATATNIEKQKDNNASPRHNSKKDEKHHHHHHKHHHHRLLCTLSAHTGSSVLCVRFSTAGHYLASAGDDACVCVYAPRQVSQQGNANFDGATGTEHWTRVQLCRGHGLDVVDLAWAPDDSHLVSCSLDSATPIVVWKMDHLLNHKGSISSMICNPYKVLGTTVHTSTVKGVTFDPAGSYLASSGDDPAVCIWRAHDDWGLEARIDASTGIFRQWKEDSATVDTSSQSLVRRISWSTDGAFVCSTNSVVKNKHVASTIAREGWAVSGGGAAASSSSGAANLVGHKQPVVVSRHAPRLLDARKKKRKSKAKAKNKDAAEEDDDKSKQDDEEEESSSEEDDEEMDVDDEPEHATLLALGDRRGFVSIWSTRKSRPIFKLQCSGESRCTVTDLSWGSLSNGDLMLLVSLLDGQLVALRFAVPDELGELLNKKDHARVFQLRYGIDLDVDGDGVPGERRMFVGGGSGPKLIENALQMTLEEDLNKNNNQMDEDNDFDDGGNNEDPFGPGDDNVASATPPAAINTLGPGSVKDQQEESRSSKGKKRVRPVLMSVDGGAAERPPKTQKPTSTAAAPTTDPLQNALEVAEKAAAAAAAADTSRKEASPAKKGQSASADDTPPARTSADTATTAALQQPRASPPGVLRQHRQALLTTAECIPYSTERVHSADLPLPKGYVVDPLDESSTTAASASRGTLCVVECVNVTKVPKGSTHGTAVPCIDISISQGGRFAWKDQILGTSCSAVAASRSLLAMGTADGSIQLFGTSPTLGWPSGSCFRSHPVLVTGHPVVSLHVEERKVASSSTKDHSRLEMLVVTADGSFAVYNLIPELHLVYKGSLLPAMTHMSLGSLAEEPALPKLSRVQITDQGRLFLLLSFGSATPNRPSSSSDRTGGARSNMPVDGGVGGSLQAFVYDRASELWLRISDSRFVLSDFYCALPSSTKPSGRAVLSKMDDAVRLGSLQSSLKASHRGRHGDRQADAIYNQREDDAGNYIASRSHCEDRMACALALKSASEFKHWLLLYVRCLTMRGNTSPIRMLVDMLLGEAKKNSTSSVETNGERIGSWWLSTAPMILELERVALVKTIVIPELSKNRSLQRLTNEIALEVQSI